MTYAASGAHGAASFEALVDPIGRLTEDSAEISRQWASIVSSSIDDSSLQNGVIPNGGDLLVERLTVEAAKKKCEQIPGCAGFTYQGPPTNELVTIFFKDKWDLQIPSATAGQWTSYCALQRVQIPMASARMAKADSGNMLEPIRPPSWSKQSWSRTTGDGRQETYQYTYSTRATPPNIAKTSLPRPDFDDELDDELLVNMRPASMPPPVIYSDAPEQQADKRCSQIHGAYALGWQVGEHGVVEPIAEFIHYLGQMFIHGCDSSRRSP